MNHSSTEDGSEVSVDAEPSNAEDTDVEREEGQDEAVDHEEYVTRTEIRKELSSLTFEELLALKDKLGTKEYNEAMFGFEEGNSSLRKLKGQKRTEFKRENKNRPREISSKVSKCPVIKQVNNVPETKKDPRFADGYGKLNEKLWNTNYSFLREMAKDEEKNLKQKFKEDKSMNNEKKEKIRTFLQRLSNKERSTSKKEEEDMKRQTAKKERLQKISEGKRPYYMKKSTKKYLELAEKYDKLKASGKVESYLKKKRARNATRDKKSLKLNTD